MLFTALSRSWESEAERTVEASETICGPSRNRPAEKEVSMQLEHSAVNGTARKLKFRTKASHDGKSVNASSGKTYVSVDCFSEGDATTPFGGFKQSGFSGRDKSIFAQYQYTELKTVWMQLT